MPFIQFPPPQHGSQRGLGETFIKADGSTLPYSSVLVPGQSIWVSVEDAVVVDPVDNRVTTAGEVFVSANFGFLCIRWHNLPIILFVPLSAQVGSIGRESIVVRGLQGLPYSRNNLYRIDFAVTTLNLDRMQRALGIIWILSKNPYISACVRSGLPGSSNAFFGLRKWREGQRRPPAPRAAHDEPGAFLGTYSHVWILSMKASQHHPFHRRAACKEMEGGSIGLVKRGGGLISGIFPQFFLFLQFFRMNLRSLFECFISEPRCFFCFFVLFFFFADLPNFAKFQKSRQSLAIPALFYVFS